MTQELHLAVGIPASGKSTWIEQEVRRLEDEHKTTAVISRDRARKRLLGVSDEDNVDEKTYFSKENEVFDEFIRQINETMELGIDIVFVDATHVSSTSRRKVLSRLVVDPNTVLVVDSFPIDTETAITRNAKRKGFAKVPEDAIRNMQNNFRNPSVSEFTNPFEYDFRQVILRCHGGG